MKNDYLAYAINFVSFILEKLDLENIKNIILFGSVSRNEATEESDVDIFLDVIGKEKEYKTKIKELTEEFYTSKFFNNYWKIKKITNDLNVITGKLDEWKELKDSIISNGITLYSKFKSMPKKYKHLVLFYFENIKPESKRVLLHKNLCGYNMNEKHYQGLLERYNGLKLNKGTILVPLEHKVIFLKLFRRFKISVRIKNIIEY